MPRHPFNRSRILRVARILFGARCCLTGASLWIDRAEVVRGGLSRRRTGRSAPDAAHAISFGAPCDVWTEERLLLPHCLSFFVLYYL